MSSFFNHIVSRETKKKVLCHIHFFLFDRNSFLLICNPLKIARLLHDRFEEKKNGQKSPLCSDEKKNIICLRHTSGIKYPVNEAFLVNPFDKFHRVPTKAGGVVVRQT